jgi:hypothetical protein
LSDDNGTDQKQRKDKLLTDYNTVLNESRVLVTFSAILFGFLLNASIVKPERVEFYNQAVLATALFSITVAVSLFIMPVVYHHLEFPYANLEKFIQRTHRFIIIGLVPTGITLYLGLELSLSFFFGYFAFVVAALPFLVVYILFRKRK